MFTLSPFLFIVAGTILSVELSVNILIEKSPKPDPLFGFIREILCISLFYGISHLILHLTIRWDFIIALVYTSWVSILALISFLSMNGRYDYMLPICIFVLVAGFIIHELSFIIGFFALFPARFIKIRLRERSPIDVIWSHIIKIRIVYLTAILGLLLIFSYLHGYP